MLIAQRLRIPGWDDEKVDIKKVVQLHLSNESAGQWLMVFDNVDEATTDAAGSFKVVRMIEYLPTSKQGTIIFTTTDSRTAITLASPNIVKLPEEEQEMAQKMLKVCLTDPPDEQGLADILAQELAYLPLAIVQAAAYINVNKITLKDYLSLLAEKKQKNVEHVREKLDDESQYRSTGNPTPITWLISFEQMRSRSLLAADYLFFIACIDWKDIPLALLPTAPPSEEKDALEILHSYSFITKRPGESALDLHRLVHLETRNWLQRHGLLSQRTKVVFTRLLEVFPDDDHWNRSKWRRLLPHAKYALSSGLSVEEDDARTDLAWKCALTLLSDGRFNEAEVYLQKVVHNSSGKLGQEHSNTLTSMTTLASTYRNQGRWKEAEKLDMEVMETSLRVLGQEHPSTLTSMGNLASTFSNQGRWKEAEELEVQVMETRKRVLGQEHPSTLTSMANLASTWKQLGRLHDALRLLEECVTLAVQVLGIEHPHTIVLSTALLKWRAEA